MCVECFSSRDCLAWLSITATSLMSMIFSKVCSTTHSLRGGSDRRGCSVSKYAVCPQWSKIRKEVQNNSWNHLTFHKTNKKWKNPENVDFSHWGKIFLFFVGFVKSAVISRIFFCTSLWILGHCTVPSANQVKVFWLLWKACPRTALPAFARTRNGTKIQTNSLHNNDTQRYRC